MRAKIFLLIFTMSIVACSRFESVEKKQIRVCTEDIKLGLNDPNSFEFISSEALKEKDGAYRIDVNFTAKNKFGGRVRGEEVCGFKAETSAELNLDDFQNQRRNTERMIRKINE